MLNRNLLAKSVGERTFLYLIAENIPVTFQKTGYGDFIVITVPDDFISYIVNDKTVELLRMEKKVRNDIVVGGITYFFTGSDVKFRSVPTVNDFELSFFVESTSKKFWRLIDNYGGWPGFDSFLLTNANYDVEQDSIEKQYPFSYHCLTGPLDDSGFIMECEIYEDSGVFVRPGDRLIPVFSNGIFADISAYEYSKKYSVNLTHHYIDCFTCFLSWVSGKLGPDKIRGAYLNNQWKLKFYSCLENESCSSSKHFYLNDENGHQFALIGCEDQGNFPVWCEKRWDSDGKWFNPECKTVEW